MELAAEQNFQTKVKKYYANMPRDESAIFPKEPLVKNHIHREVKIKDIDENLEKIALVEQKVEMRNSSINERNKTISENRNDKNKTINNPKNNQTIKAVKAYKGNKVKADSWPYRIPGILHRQWITSRIPRVQAKMIRSWRKQKPQLKQYFWTESSLDNYLRQRLINYTIQWNHTGELYHARTHLKKRFLNNFGFII